MEKEVIIKAIRQSIEDIWNNSPYPEIGIEEKIINQTPLTKEESDYFIQSESWKMNSLRGVLPYGIAGVVNNNSDLIEILAGKHSVAEANRKSEVLKVLLLIDEKERFFVDLFYFPPSAETPEHAHNAHCVSFQLLGNLVERERQPLTNNHDRILLIRKAAGTSTMVSPYYYGDESLDIHAIANNSGKPAATIHVYSQRVLGEDGIVRINRSDLSTGPTSVKKYFYPNKEWQLATR